MCGQRRWPQIDEYAFSRKDSDKEYWPARSSGLRREWGRVQERIESRRPVLKQGSPNRVVYKVGPCYFWTGMTSVHMRKQRVFAVYSLLSSPKSAWREFKDRGKNLFCSDLWSWHSPQDITWAPQTQHFQTLALHFPYSNGFYFNILYSPPPRLRFQDFQCLKSPFYPSVSSLRISWSYSFMHSNTFWGYSLCQVWLQVLEVP